MSRSRAEPSGALVRPDRRGLDEQIAAAIIDAVLAGDFPPGEPLPPERDLAEQLHVNRTSLRQALARLEQAGLIVRRQGSGNVVQDPRALTDPAVVRAMARRLDPDFLAELVEMREGLGAMIGRLAAERATDGDLAAMASALDAVAGAGAAAERQRAELAFFASLMRATHNRALALLLRWVESAYGGSPSGFERAFDDADAVVTGVRRIHTTVSRHQQRAAAAAVETYLHDSGRRLLASADGANR